MTKKRKFGRVRNNRVHSRYDDKMYNTLKLKAAEFGESLAATQAIYVEQGIRERPDPFDLFEESMSRIESNQRRQERLLEAVLTVLLKMIKMFFRVVSARENLPRIDRKGTTSRYESFLGELDDELHTQPSFFERVESYGSLDPSLLETQ